MINHQKITEPQPRKKKPVTAVEFHSKLKSCKSVVKVCTFILLFQTEIDEMKAHEIHTKRQLSLPLTPVLL